MTAVDQIIALADKLREVRDIAERRASLEQAIRESEARLAQLRAAEAVIAKENVAAEARAAQAGLDAERRARDVLQAAQDEAAKRLADCTAEIAARRRQAVAGLDAAAQETQRRLADCARLEAEEAKLGQSVAALKADLEAIRSRLAG